MTENAVEQDREDDFETAFEEFAEEPIQEQDDVETEEYEDDDKGEHEQEEPEQEEQYHEEPDLAAQLEEIRRQNEQLEHYKKSNEGRVSALQKKIDELLAAQQQPEPEEEQDDDWSAFEEEDEFVASKVDGRINRTVQKLKQELLNEVETKLTPFQEQQQQLYINEQLNILDKKKPGWSDTVKSSEYQNWLNNQHPVVQQLADSMDANDYMHLLDNYEKDLKLAETKQAANGIKEKRKQSLAANETIKNRGQGRVSGPPDDFNAAFDYYANLNERKR